MMVPGTLCVVMDGPVLGLKPELFVEHCSLILSHTVRQPRI